MKTETQVAESPRTQATPGPWSLEEQRISNEGDCAGMFTGFYLNGPKRDDDTLPWVASIHGEHVRIPADECRANAKLIAAAPSTYALVIRLHDALEHVQSCRACNERPWDECEHGGKEAYLAMMDARKGILKQ